MAINLILSDKTAKDIDGRIERVLQGLGNPEPPLRLEDVRELLKLDTRFYQADDPGLVDEVVSRIRVASIQVYKRPTLLLDAIKKMSLKALYIPDRKRILLDASLPVLKHRWNEAHEVGHSLLPWHEDVMHGDNDHTLSRDCHEQIEAEANFAAGRLLFLRDRFDNEARSRAASFSTVQELKGSFGNTMSTTLYRYVESVGVQAPTIGMITCHPHSSRRSSSPDNFVRHLIRSQSFAVRFGNLTGMMLFQRIAEYCGSQRGGLLGADEIVLNDCNGVPHVFVFETFYNSYDALTLGVYMRPHWAQS